MCYNIPAIADKLSKFSNLVNFDLIIAEMLLWTIIQLEIIMDPKNLCYWPMLIPNRNYKKIYLIDKKNHFYTVRSHPLRLKVNAKSK